MARAPGTLCAGMSARCARVAGREPGTHARRRAAAVHGRRLRHALERQASRFPVVQEIRGRGLMLGMQIGGPQARPDPATFTAMLAYRCWELGAVVYPVGTSSDVVEFTPPLILSPGEAALGTDIIGQGIEDVLAGRVPADAVATYQGW